MPKVNVKYKLNLAPTITNVHHLVFGEVHAKSSDKKSAVLYEGKVEGVYVTNKLFVNLLLGGFAGKWDMQVSVIKLDAANKETGSWYKLKTYPIKGDLKKGNHRMALYEIKW